MDSTLSRSKKRTMIIIVSIWIAFLVIFLLLVNLPWSPIFKSLGGDSGLYAYIGKAILNGQLPYRDVWEHKPPIGFYLNALAIFIFGQTPWAPWWFNFVWMSLTTVAFFLVVKKITGLLAGCIASIVFTLALMSPDIFQGGNFMEIYGLLPQVLIIGTVYVFFSTKQNRWCFILGVLTSIAFLTKQTTIALGITSFLAILYVDVLTRNIKRAFPRAGLYLAGVIIPVGLISLIWLKAGALGDFLDAVFLHSVAFVQTGGFSLKSLYGTLSIALLEFPLGVLYNIAIASLFLYFVLNDKWLIPARRLSKDRVEIEEVPAIELTMLGVFLALPLEIAFASAGGRNFGHYFISCVPAVTTAVAYLIQKVINSLKESRINVIRTNIWAPVALAMLTFMSLGWLVQAAVKVMPRPVHLASLPQIFSSPYQMDDLAKYIVQNTNPDDPVLVWHIHVGINFITDRRPPTPYLFPLNLFISSGESDNLFEKFLVDLQDNPPKLIVVQQVSSIGLPFVNVPLDQLCAAGCVPEVSEAMKRPEFYSGMEQLKQYFDEHYVFDAQIYDFLIYRRVR